ncbi:hypothetical protein BJ546DRAFT_1070454 [Cryomyces antarcticus]|nr:hypothetical protein LTR04_004018 [Oleoguttula sp. CCFEE 6159]
MSAEYKGQDPLEIAKQAERDLNSHEAKHGHDAALSTLDSGVDDSVTNKFPGSTVTIGSAASGAGDNREIPVEEGGNISKETGRPTKARDFEGAGGPEDKAAQHEDANPGDDDVRSNIRQGGETRRP